MFRDLNYVQKSTRFISKLIHIKHCSLFLQEYNRKNMKYPPLVLGICARSMFYTNWYKIEMINNCVKVQEFIIIRKNQYRNNSHGIILVVDTKIKSNVNVLFYYLVQMLRMLTFWFVRGTKTLNIKCNVRNLFVRTYITK